MKELRRCKQCGYQIVPCDTRAATIAAQKAGFCTVGCSEVYAAIKDDLRHEAEKDLAREMGL